MTEHVPFEKAVQDTIEAMATDIAELNAVVGLLNTERAAQAYTIHHLSEELSKLRKELEHHVTIGDGCPHEGGR